MSNNQDSIVIIGGARTPMGGMMGSLSEVPAPELGATAIKAAVTNSGIDPQTVDQVIMGCVLPSAMKQAPARQASLGAGLPYSAGCVTISKMCGSGMKAVMDGHDQIKAGSSDIIVAGGMENMSAAPYLLPKGRGGMRMGHGQVLDSMFYDGLEDAYTGKLMGAFTQDCADDHGLTREAMDAFAIESLGRANQAIKEGWFEAEMSPVTITTRKGETIVSVDEQPGNANIEKIPSLRPAFKKDGTVTAANASSISDGGSAVVLMRESQAKEQGLAPLARIVGHATHSLAPSEFVIAPIGAIKKLLDKVNWSVEDVDLWEINEAFAAVTMLAMQELKLDPKLVNIHGGACALGHPVGSSGSRIIISLIYALKRLGKKRGIAALCIGGGEATAVAIEII
ncbi:acetyl-CoA C-acyltransferase [Paraglaciecola sp. 20A4]|uniref:thiolase family protein n=1 Tax=Paraglaciecola sp. 20A4 TaxID=2687288 RepID=UPI00140C948E|nr:acetyl-CoA C-acyltransferase [Paraglaciecola sp. 20A4]